MVKKNSKTVPQYAKVEQPFGMDPVALRCPICGEFEYQSKDFRKRAKKLGEEAFCLEEFPESLVKAGYGNHLLVIEITYGGMACGPVW